MNSSAKGDADRHCLAARFVDGPHAVRARQSRTASGGLARRSRAGAGGRDPRSCRAISAAPRPSCSGIAEASPYLFDLVRADAARADPAARMRSGAASGRTDRDDLPRRRGRSERSRRDAAAAPHEVGSRAADRAVRHRRRLAGDAGDGGADRSRGRLGADRRCAICCGRKPRAAGCRRPIPIAPRTTAAWSCSRWARWARAS